MTALRAFRRPRVWLTLWGLMIAAVVAGSLLPASAVPAPPFPGADKLEHLLGYAALSAYAAMLFAGRRASWAAAIGLMLLGLVIEGAQSMFTTTRLADPRDMLANSAGVALGQALRVSRAAGLLLRIDGWLPG